jgi:hypothetical protein
MTKLKKLLKGVATLVQKPYMINKIIDNEDIHKEACHKTYPAFVRGLPIIDFRTIVPESSIEIAPFAFMDGGSLVTDIALLKSVAGQQKDCQYFEIGTWRGESVANVAKTAKDCFTLNISAEEIRKLGFDELTIGQQDVFSKDLANVKHLKGNSLTFDFGPYKNKMDLVFIDGDHHYDAVKKDTEKAFDLLKDEDSIIIWHDYAFNPETVRWDVFRGILDGTPEKYRKHLYQVSNTMCAIYYPHEVATIPYETKIEASKQFVLNLSVKEL